MKFQVSDWVQGSTESGELIQGFVVERYESEAVAKVQVVTSDNEEAVGRIVSIREARLKEIPMSEATPGQLEDLINLALATRDEAWFAELSARLSQGSAKEDHSKRRVDSYTSVNNRLDPRGLNKLGG